jgi:drug/metabolite transporter (DMT)-like permease
LSRELRSNHGIRLYGLVGVMILLWSLNYSISKIALREFPAPLLVGLRLLIAGVCMLPLYWWEGRGGKHLWHWHEAPMLLAIGVAGGAMNQLLFAMGLERTTVVHAAFLVGMAPIFVLLLASSRGQEHFSGRKVWGILVALSGVMVIQFFRVPGGGGAGPSLAGDLLIVASGVMFAMFTVLGKESSRTHGTITMNAFAYVGGALLMSPYTAWKSMSFAYHRVSPAGWASVAYMAVFPSVVCYLIYYYALAWMPASRMSMFNYLQPVLASLLGWMLLGEPITPPVVGGGALVMAGVYLVGRG